ncbi:MAG: hypothetical protein ACOVO2_06480, partial [Emticicia sp.]|uniref:hypothetical protein n=1 Tax=Emticicia sp. TaxID=1930953 RepID=UPI003BA7A6B7
LNPYAVTKENSKRCSPFFIQNLQMRRFGAGNVFFESLRGHKSKSQGLLFWVTLLLSLQISKELSSAKKTIE